jgi:hypothetical protein
MQAFRDPLVGGHEDPRVFGEVHAALIGTVWGKGWLRVGVDNRTVPRRAQLSAAHALARLEFSLVSLVAWSGTQNLMHIQWWNSASVRAMTAMRRRGAEYGYESETA